MRDKLQEFIDSDSPNTWLEDSEKAVYVRKATHYHPRGEIVSTFDIANIHVEHQKTGVFTRLVSEIFQKTDVEFVYVESVLNSDFAKALQRKGYEAVGTPPSFFIHRAKFQN